VRLLHLYRPRLPTARAQAIQVLHTCHALAASGVEVTLLADRVGPGDADAVASETEPARVLEAYGLEPVPGLDLQVAPTRHPPSAGLWYRWAVSRWRGDVVYARPGRYLPLVPAAVPVVLEQHEVEVALAEEAGQDPGPVARREAAALGRARGVVANCAGTLGLLAERYPLPPARVIWNATRADRRVPLAPAADPVVGWIGSPHAWKGLATVLRSVPSWPARLRIVGGVPADLPPGVEAEGPVAYGEVPARLARFHALLLPLDDTLYGRTLANPLKLWDYLATGLPVVAADLPSVREVGPGNLFLYRPGDPDSLADAVRRALLAGPGAPRVRTWADRATEIVGFLGEVLR